MSFGVIYKVVNQINGKIYVGQTVQGLKQRKYKHKLRAERIKKGKIKRNKYFYSAINKYGWNNFEWKIIDYAENR